MIIGRKEYDQSLSLTLCSCRTNEWTVACKEFNIEIGRVAGVLAQRALSLLIREFEDEDYSKLAEIYEAIFPERARSLEEWRFYDDSLDKTKYLSLIHI